MLTLEVGSAMNYKQRMCYASCSMKQYILRCNTLVYVVTSKKQENCFFVESQFSVLYRRVFFEMEIDFHPPATPMRLYCSGDKQFDGFFCTVDPLSGNVVLCSLTTESNGEKAKFFIVTGWSIKKIEVGQ